MQLVKLLEALKKPYNLGQFPSLHEPLEAAITAAKKLPADTQGRFSRKEMYPERMAQINRRGSTETETADHAFLQTANRFRPGTTDAALKPITKEIEKTLGALADATLEEGLYQWRIKHRDSHALPTEYEKTEMRNGIKESLAALQSSFPCGTTMDTWMLQCAKESQLNEALSEWKSHIGGGMFHPDTWNDGETGVEKTAKTISRESGEDAKEILLSLAGDTAYKAYLQFQNLNVALAEPKKEAGRG